tara:strand:- start:37 stop:378 length:342 start_codon:yes stop_codon:yes gene_type:complete
MEKYLYFAQGDGANATSEAVMYPVSAFRGADVASSAIQLWFTGAESSNQADDDNEDLVTLTVTNGKQKEVLKAIAEAMAAQGSMKEPFVVIADEDNSVFIHPAITVVETTLSA